jgi:hypothetical protein
MKRRTMILGLALLLNGAFGAAHPWAAGTDDANAAAAFDRLKALVGEWEAETASMGKTRLTYELTAGGTALLERESFEKMPSMVTMYHLDGARLLLTHYCMAGNQPRMVARSYDRTTGVLDFEFLDATNMTGPGAGHMRSVTMRFVDASHITSEWRFFENGTLRSTETARYTRVR